MIRVFWAQLSKRLSSPFPANDMISFFLMAD